MSLEWINPHKMLLNQIEWWTQIQYHLLSLRLVNEKLLLTQKSLLKLEHTTLSTWKTNFNCGFGPNFGSHSDQIWTVIIYNSCNNNNNKRMWKTLYKLHIENAPNEVRTRTVLLTTASSCSGRLLWLHQANTQFDWIVEYMAV